MSIAFNVILHILLLGSLLLFVIVLLATAFAETSPLERFLRVAAIFAGAMVAVGAASSGVGYASFIVNSLSGARTASAMVHVLTTLVPALIGSGIGFYLVRTIRKSETFAIRIFGFVGMLATTAFIEVYAEAATQNGFRLGAAALPNIGFTAGVILTVVFTLRTDGSSAPSAGMARSLLGTALRRRLSGQQPDSAGHLTSPASGQGTDGSSDGGVRGL